MKPTLNNHADIIRQRVTFVLATTLLLCAQSAFAADLGLFSGLTNTICSIQALVSGPVLFAVGVVVIIVGAIAFSAAESTIVKILMTVIIGLGIAAAAIPVAKSLGIQQYC